MTPETPFVARAVVFVAAVVFLALLFVGSTVGIVVHVDESRHVIRLGNIR